MDLVAAAASGDAALARAAEQSKGLKGDALIAALVRQVRVDRAFRRRDSAEHTALRDAHEDLRERYDRLARLLQGNGLVLPDDHLQAVGE